VGIPLTVGFRPQLVVVSGLSVGIPLTVGLGHNLLLSQAFRWDPFDGGILAFTEPLAINKPFHKLFLFHDRIMDITKPFTRTLPFFTMELWLSQSLVTIFSFTRWNSGYHEASSRIFLSHDGISAITEPFHEFFFHMMESRLSRSLFTTFSFT
jgi:hypothetical protein